MKVLQVVNTLGLGGAETRLLSLVAGSTTGLEHHVAYLGGAEDLLPRFLAAGATVHCLGVTTKLGLPLGALRLSTIMRRHHFDLVDTHSVHAALAARAAATVVRTPVCMTQHHAHHPKSASSWYRAERATRRYVSAAVAISSATLRELLDSGFSGRTFLIPTGIDAELWRSYAVDTAPWRTPYILMVGQFRDLQKGHDVLLRALARIRERGLTPTALLVGDGSLRLRMERLAADLGLSQQVHFLGERLDVANLMAHCEVFVLPSRWEGFGRVLLEAMVVGACVVASCAEGIPEVIDTGVSGVLVPPGDHESLANALESVLTQPTTRLRLGRQGQDLVLRNFRLERMCQLTLDAYHLVASHHKL